MIDRIDATDRNAIFAIGHRIRGMLGMAEALAVAMAVMALALTRAFLDDKRRNRHHSSSLSCSKADGRRRFSAATPYQNLVSKKTRGRYSAGYSALTREIDESCRYGTGPISG